LTTIWWSLIFRNKGGWRFVVFVVVELISSRCIIHGEELKNCAKKERKEKKQLFFNLFMMPVVHIRTFAFIFN
jgi:hypothetical protein